jgi:16S rRNA (guanine1516-N2)-methyltransferase
LAGWQGNTPDVVYLDPMFPHRKKSAAVKKEMRLFQQLLGSDDDADLLLEPALTLAKKRVVVKRPSGAPFLANKKPHIEMLGKANRFDVYLIQNRN